MFAIFAALIIGIVWSFFEGRKLKQELAAEEEQFRQTKNIELETEIRSAIDYIEYNRSNAQARMKLELQVRVDEAWRIAENIYKENAGKKSRVEIEKMIKDAIRPIRFANERGDVFIYNLSGVSVLLPRSPDKEGTNSINHQDNTGNFVVKKEVLLLQQVDRGYLDYYIKNEFSKGDSILQKSTYVRKFEPLGWYLGSKDYLVDFEADLKKDILERLSKVRFGVDGYVFVNSVDGYALVSNGERYTKPYNILESDDQNWKTVFKNQQQLFHGSGKGYLEYSFKRLSSNDLEEKITYFSSVKPWGWIVGAGYYTSEVEEHMAAKLAGIQELKRKAFFQIVIVLILLVFIIWQFAGFMSNRILKGFHLFERSFRKSTIGNTEMDIYGLAFTEFRQLASSVNEITRQLNITSKNLIKEQSLLRSLIDSNPDFIFFKDLNSNYVGCNRAFSHYLGISENELIGKNDFDFFSKEFAEKYHENDRKIVKQQQPIRTEEWITHSDGSKHLMDTFKVLYYDKSGKALGIMAISRDITELEETRINLKAAKDKAEEADKLKTAFLANMSHEIRTPMNSIIGFSNLLIEENLTAEEKEEYVGHINHGSETLLKLIDDIIDIAKIEAGQLSVTYDSCNLNDVMNELYVTHSSLLSRRHKNHIRLIKEATVLSKGPEINSDEFRLKQVLSNLLVNAIKFTDDGSITFGYNQLGDFLEFYVKDTGIGISPEGQRVIFDRFRQDNQNGIKHAGGTGLGLAISQHIVNLLGGQIKVDSISGQGSVFSFTIPYSPGENKQTAKADNQPPKFDYNWNGKSLLVVEDIESNFKFIYAALFRTGIKILRAVDGLEALNMVNNNGEIDIILMDVNMPVMNGYEATAEIKKLRPELPVIAQTAYAMQGEAQKSANAGCDAYLSKPVDLKSLFDVMSRYLNT
jgi:PAS domain S-box-containing protein